MRATLTRVPPPPAPELGRWHRRVHPWVLDKIMDTTEARRIRAEVCAPLAGEVLEIGFGTGHNLPHLPPAVTRLLAVEPLERGRHHAAERLAAARVEVQFTGSDARTLPLPDRSVDAVLCTWSLCSIDDPVRAVEEIGRVLRPGAALHFVEHGRSPDERVGRRQRRWDPLWSRAACGCHLDRDIPGLLEAGGLRIVELERYYTESEPKFLGWTYQGRATAR